jgi:EAL domain-containing protein (putative c-di-GMP-specific phosphodiesterase class I)/GGDEF domain-containing protein
MPLDLKQWTEMQAPAARALLAKVDAGLRIALQPIVEVHSGTLYGLEALLRGHDAMGFAGPVALLDAAADLGVLQQVESLAHARAVAAFAALPEAATRRLFVNLDGRLVHASDESPLAGLMRALVAHRLPATVLCVELSERQSILAAAQFRDAMASLRQAGVRFAADDFGLGFSEMRLLFEGNLDYIKIDRLFIHGIAENPRQRLFVAHICGFAHVLGLRVVAEGIETEADFLVCRELGCDLAQGWFVAHPTLNLAEVRASYHQVVAAVGRERRNPEGDAGLLRHAAEPLPTVLEDADVDRVFELFSNAPGLRCVPVLDLLGAPRGVVREADLRRYIYGRFGRDLLRNRAVDRRAGAFISVCPVAEVSWPAEQVLELFAASPGAEGVLLTEGQRYLGMLSAAALLTLLNEVRLHSALDQNPLTRLPGNLAVAAHVAAAAVRSEQVRHLCYFDFDNFKPFNDRHGFRQGDRMITLFAEALRRHFPAEQGGFLGHIGGDDFFGGFAGLVGEALRQRLASLLRDFAETAAGLYTAEERAAGGILAQDRDGQPRIFPLLRCSVALLELPGGEAACEPERLMTEIAALKTEAKRSEAGLASRTTHL